MNLLVDFGGRCCLGSQYKLDEERASDVDDGSVTAKSNNSSSRDEACNDDLAKELSEIIIDDSFQLSSGADNDDLNSIDDSRKKLTKNNVVEQVEKKGNEKNRRRSCIYTKIYQPSEEEKSSMNRLGETMKQSFPVSSKVVSTNQLFGVEGSNKNLFYLYTILILSLYFCDMISTLL